MIIILPIVAVVALASLGMRRIYARRDTPLEQFDRVQPTEFDDRLERVAQAVDVIATELQRVSENQRTLSRVLAERPPVDRQVPPASSG